jgi:cytochrome c peroxidase
MFYNFQPLGITMPFISSRPFAPSLSFTSAVALLILLLSSSANSQSAEGNTPNPPWQAGAFRHVEEMRTYRDPSNAPQQTPPTIPRLEQLPDPSGRVGSLNLNGPTRTRGSAFFESLGTNQRTCFTCHQPQDGWSFSSASARQRFASSNGGDPLFRVIDGAVCPNSDVSTTPAKREAYRLLLGKGLIRVFLPLPSNRDFQIKHVEDPYGCNYRPGQSNDMVSFYRRPLPTANLGFLTTIMWDGRETSFQTQAIDATKLHAEARDEPTTEQVNDIVNFEMGLFAAQSFDKQARALDAACAKGGPSELQKQFPDFYRGVNDPLGNNPRNLPFTSQVFDDYTAWWHLDGLTSLQKEREKVERGERVFNETSFLITDVPGLNDQAHKQIEGFCGTCHDSPNVGNHSVPAPLNIGVSNAGPQRPPVLDISGLPVFTVKCDSGDMVQVTDIGRAMMTGRCNDVGKVKGPILRGLAARAPYFHNGSAATLREVVNFYEQRFNIGLSEGQKEDLVAFLLTL